MPKINAPTLAEHRAETHDALLEAWGELVLERGYDAVKLSDVAQAVGLARSAIYNYFPDREALLFAWTDRLVAQTIEELERETAEAETCAEKLAVFVRVELQSFAEAHLQPGREVVHLMGPESFARFMAHIEPVEALLRTILVEGMDAGEFRRSDPDELLPMIMATIGAERGPMSSGAHALDEASPRVTGFLLRALGADTAHDAPV